MPTEVAKSMGVTDVFDPRQNIMGGSRYLQVLIRKFCRTPAPPGSGLKWVCSHDEVVKVISGYHAGPYAVLKYGGMPPYETTKNYVNKVLKRWRKYEAEAKAKKKTPPKPAKK